MVIIFSIKTDIIKNSNKWLKFYLFTLGNERKVYEYIVRHFLACLSKDAEGLETVVEIDINNERVFKLHYLFL